MYGFEGVCLSDVQLSISELSVLGGWTGQTHTMVGPGRGPTIMHSNISKKHISVGGSMYPVTGPGRHSWTGQVCEKTLHIIVFQKTFFLL